VVVNYYNEFDPNAAAWLAGFTLSILTHPAGISSYQVARDMSGRESTPSKAICSSASFATARFFRNQVCEPHQAREFPRNSRMISERQDCDDGTALSSSLGVVSPLCVADIGIPAQDSFCAIPGLISLLAPGDKHPSMSISGFVGVLLEKLPRSSGIRARSLDWDGWPISTQLRIFESKNPHLVSERYGDFRIPCSFLS
jgi:hypothetical protein